MEFDIGNLVYILFLVIVFVLNLFSKAKKKREQNRPGQEGSTTVGPPPISKGKSFEELLEEFTGNTPEPPPIPAPVEHRPAPKPKPAPVVYREKSKPKPVPQTQKTHSVLTTEFKRFEEFEDDDVEGTDYAELFEDHDSAQKAFVLSEIFQRKY
ncbi:MAG: hypothetical protein HEP71_24070 [Roseivirga sp.]|nr:hypothetical protein [Roseivirga sp.]